MRWVLGEWFYAQPIRGVVNLLLSLGLAYSIFAKPELLQTLLLLGAFFNSLYAGRQL